jgi:zinc/manganese transport system substrate-binding protein
MSNLLLRRLGAGAGVCLLLLIGCGPSTEPLADDSWQPGTGGDVCPGPVLHVIAVENQYGSIVRQLGGQGVRVKSIIADPSADPHEYQANAQTLKDYHTAQLVVQNGLGYDDFSGKIIETLSPRPRVITAGDVVGLKVGDNPHVWYDPAAIDKVAQAITAALKELNPQGAASFDAQAQTFQKALTPYDDAIARIRSQYHGTPIGATETVFAYMAEATGLDLISPAKLMDAIAEGNAPSAQDVATFEDQIHNHGIKVLVYNKQTITNLTTRLQDLARAEHIPVVGVTETMVPADTAFQAWQVEQLKALEEALASAKGN